MHLLGQRRAHLVRRDEFPDGQGTPGDVFDENGDLICHMLELPWRDNTPCLSCIPPLIYNLSPWSSRKYRNALHVQNVPGRSAILIHGGNLAGDTTMNWLTHSLGCQLPCTSFGSLKGQLAGLASQPSLRRLLAYNPASLAVIEAVEGRMAA